MGRYKILIGEPKDFSQEVIDSLKEISDVTILPVTKENLKNAFREYDVVWFRLGFKVDKEVLDGNIKCKIIVVPVTGLDHIDVELCKEKGIEIISLKEESEFLKEIRATAELTIALTLCLIRKLIPAYNSVIDGKWERDDYRGTEIYGKNVGIIGVGRLGKITADYFNAFGANVAGYDIRDDFPENIKRVRKINKLVENSDIVTVHVSYNESTRRLIGKEVLNSFKNDAVLINTSRGDVIDEVDLLDRLKNGSIKGAALDVIQNERNVNSNNPLIQYAKSNNNLILFPHIGGNTFESFEKTEKFLAEKLFKRLLQS